MSDARKLAEEPDVRLIYPEIDRAMTRLEALADQWAIEIDLPKMVACFVKLGQINPGVPAEIRAKFLARQGQLISDFIEQAFIEGAYRGATGAFDAVRAGYIPQPEAE